MVPTKSGIIDEIVVQKFKDTHLANTADGQDGGAKTQDTT